MMTITISQFIKDEYDVERVYKEGHRIYVVREGDIVFYVGQSKNIPQRLLQHLGISHLPTGVSELGRLVLRNGPVSRNWQIDLMTLADCVPSVERFGGYTDNGSCDPETAEAAMILAYKPCMNRALNPDPTPLPDQYCEDPDGQGAMEAVRAVLEE